MRLLNTFGFVAMTSISVATISTATANDDNEPAIKERDIRRGSPAEYDPGPSKDENVNLGRAKQVHFPKGHPNFLRGDKNYAFGQPYTDTWVRIFGETPNYRRIAEKLSRSSSEKFRWNFGPMHYRGRLTPQSVKVFIVGQEGAQDENISNRTFTGSTGTKTQKFLNHLGIWDSYLFMNTFVYTINGQLSEDPWFQWMEQDTRSPVVQYRHRMFDHMAITNNETLALLMGVGTGGKASVATWVNARGGKCSTANNLRNCDTSGMKAWFRENYGVELEKDIFVIGVPHPGGASPNNGGLDALMAIIRGFTDAAKRVADRVVQDKFRNDPKKAWLYPDNRWDDKLLVTVEQRDVNLRKNFQYGNAPVPFKDFAFGTNWRMGASGTTSNRRKPYAIQIFSSQGTYNGTAPYDDRLAEGTVTDQLFEDGGKLHHVSMAKEAVKVCEMITDGRKEKILKDYADAKYEYPGDLPYESPKYFKSLPARASAFDYGPCGDSVSCSLSRILQGEGAQKWPDFSKFGVSQHSSFGTGPIYRGTWKGPQLVILSEPLSYDDLFSGRALTGEFGQRLQTWLKVLGAEGKYLIIRTSPVDTLELSQDKRKALADASNPILTAILKEAINDGTKLVITISRDSNSGIAQYALDLAKKSGLKTSAVLSLTAPSKSNEAEWSEALIEARTHLKLSGSSSYDASILSSIPRGDLPIQTRWWMGTSGNRALKGKGTGDYFKLVAPAWTRNLKPVTHPTDEESLEFDGAGRSGHFTNSADLDEGFKRRVNHFGGNEDSENDLDEDNGDLYKFFHPEDPRYVNLIKSWEAEGRDNLTGGETFHLSDGISSVELEALLKLVPARGRDGGGASIFEIPAMP